MSASNDVVDEAPAAPEGGPSDAARRSWLGLGPGGRAPRRGGAGPLRLGAVLGADRSAALGLVLLVLTVACAALAPWLAPDPAQGAGAVATGQRDLPPSAAHLFGTDHLGRDIVSRVIYGARPAVLSALVVVAVSVVVGALLGALAGYLGGWMDEVLSRVTDVALSFPPLLLTMVIAALLGPSFWHVVLALAISWWPWYYRLVRTSALSLRDRGFVEAARVSGAPPHRVVLRHVLPNALAAVPTQVSIDVGSVILATGALAFLGLGTQPPTADWGLMIAEGRDTVATQWWIPTFPGLAIFVVVLGANLLGDGLQARRGRSR